MQNPNGLENLSASNEALNENLEKANLNTGDSFPPNFRAEGSEEGSANKNISDHMVLDALTDSIHKPEGAIWACDFSDLLDNYDFSDRDKEPDYDSLIERFGENNSGDTVSDSAEDVEEAASDLAKETGDIETDASDLTEETGDIEADASDLTEETGDIASDSIEDKGDSSDILIETEIRTDIPGYEGQEILVTGNPLETAEHLDSSQGDNSYNALGDCALTSCANFLTMCGIESTEEEIVGYAVENGLCDYGPYLAPESLGGADDNEIITILEDHNVGVDVYYPNEAGGSVEGLAEALEDGHAVTIGINAGVLWNDAASYGDGSVNHQITLTGTLRNSETNELEGFVACDSGIGQGALVINLDIMENCYTSVQGASAVISDAALRISDEEPALV
ncbi:MAG: hypothetical protein LIO44_06660 [Eubacterium sp.]|nr:hypothetical protein [Eubacterium sp.]